MKNKLRHVGIVVKDIEHSIKFWTDIFGFKIISRQIECGDFIDKVIGINGINVETVKLINRNKDIVELLKFITPSNEDKLLPDNFPYDYGLRHIAFTVDNIEVVLNLIENFGINNLREPQLSLDGKVRVLYISVHENLILELVEEVIK